MAVLCYSRLIYIEFTLSQRKAEFYRGIVNALRFFGGRPRAIIFDNLKAGVINGSGRSACFHPEFLRCVATSACSRSPANGATQSQKESSRRACATSSAMPWPDAPMS